MRTATPHSRPVVAAMVAGLALTVAALVVPYLDRAGLAGHIHVGYPELSPAEIDDAVHTYLIILTVVGVLGVLCWLAVIRAVTAGKSWARWVAAGSLAVGTTLALTALLIKDTSGDTGLPPLLGWIGLLPCLAGALAVALLLRRHRTASRPA